MYQLKIRQRILKVLDKLDEPLHSRLMTAIVSLADNPRPYGYKKLSGRPGYRIRVGNYRVIYEIFDNALIIEVIQVDHRSVVYGKWKGRL